MKYQVNMLDRSEARRVEGIVNRSFYLTLAAVIVAGAATLITLLTMQYAQARSHLDMVEARWEESKERYEEIFSTKMDTSKRRAVLAQLIAWRNSGMSWNTALNGLPYALPDSVQITRLQVHGNLEYLEPPAEDQAFIPTRQYKVKLSGRATGTDGDQTIISLVNELPRAPEFGERMDSAKLLMMQTDNHVREGDPVRTFAIEGYFNGWRL